MSDSIVKFTPEMLSVIAGKNNIPLPFQKDIFLIEIQVAGTSFRRNIKELEPQLESGQMYRMVREPENKYDANAIAIYFEEEKLGYIPAEQNEIMARLMDVGKLFYCKLISKEWVHNWLRLKTEVFMKD